MPAETALAFSDLEAQARGIMGLFEEAGYELVAPSILQPAGLFLDVVGEDLRARSYVFQDPGGELLCLRPDLTVPTCRLYLERCPGADRPARYAYNGACFRFQPEGESRSRPREFRQAGIESFGAADREAAEAEVMGLTVAAVRGAGLARFTLRLGDLAIFRALLAGLDMPERWRADLLHHFWRPEAFLRHLKRLTTEPGRRPPGVPAELFAALEPWRPEAAEEAVARHLTDAGLDLQGSRSLAEIASHLAALADDARAKPLAAASAQLIEDYVKVRGKPRSAPQRIGRLAQAGGVDVSAALESYRRRLEQLAAAGIDVDAAEFSAEFGRNFEYYTGFVFQIEAPELGAGINIAGGGRYDRLLETVGAPRPVPAVGAAIHTERLLAIVRQ
jgi:ATP phosphoribosyltransferase regulatory subunit